MAHWGLTRWIYGISEYVDRCLCCDTKRDANRAFVHENMTTDCGCISEMRSCDNLNDPMIGMICLPIMIITHLLYLPVACCSPNENGFYGTGSLEQQNQDDREHRFRRFEEIKLKK